MKNNATNNVRSLVRSVLTPAAFACMLIAGFVPSTAYAGNTTPTEQFQNPVQIKYVGKVDSQPIYQVDIDNAAEASLYVTLRDEDGSLLYSDNFKGKKFSKKFQFNLPNGENLKITLGIASKGTKKAQVLQFSNVVKTYEDVLITRL